MSEKFVKISEEFRDILIDTLDKERHTFLVRKLRATSVIEILDLERLDEELLNALDSSGYFVHHPGCFAREQDREGSYDNPCNCGRDQIIAITLDHLDIGNLTIPEQIDGAPTEEEYDKLLELRDSYEDLIGDVAEYLGCKEEWSSAHSHISCLREHMDQLIAPPTQVPEALGMDMSGAIQIGWFDPDEPGLVWNMEDHDDDLSEFHRPVYDLAHIQELPQVSEIRSFNEKYRLGFSERQIDGVVSFFLAHLQRSPQGDGILNDINVGHTKS